MRCRSICLHLGILFSFAANAFGDDFAAIKEIKDYKHWSFVRGPFRVSPGMEALCSHPPFVGHPGTTEDAIPSQFKETRIRVYANGAAAQKLKRVKGTQKNSADSAGNFQPGSVIVKEKLYPGRSEEPESLGIMIKRKKGFDPRNGDWEILVLASGKRIARGFKELSSCYQCHRESSFGPVGSSDFVFVDSYR